MEFDINNLLNGKSKLKITDTTAVSTEENNIEEFKIIMLDAEDLMPSKDNFYSTEQINELATSIEILGGIEQNLIVKPLAHGKYEVVAGHRRRLAALKLVNEGKEQYRKVPCRIKTESDSITDKLRLIFTNSTVRELSDWEKVQQAKTLKELLTEYKKTLDEEMKEAVKEGNYCKACEHGTTDTIECNHEGIDPDIKGELLQSCGKDCNYYERRKFGRIREIVSQMLNVSTTQVGRMEAIENNLSEDFKVELEKGNINISTAHELSRLQEEQQEIEYEKYEQKGELHIKDVKEEPKEEISEEQIENVQMVIKNLIKGEINRRIFNDDKGQGIKKILEKEYAKTYKGGKIELEEGRHYIYRFNNEGITIIDEEWQNFLITYEDFADIIYLMIENKDLEYDDSPEESEEITEPEKEIITPPVKEVMAAGQQDTNIPLLGQMEVEDFEETLPDVTEKGLSFTEWIAKRYLKGQLSLIQGVVRETISRELQDGEKCPKEWESRIANDISVWLMSKTQEYKKYLES